MESGDRKDSSARATFPKREHIVSTKLIEVLFGSGSKSMAAFPLRAVYHKIPREQTDVPVQVLISVPKKHFKHAVDRNRVKRQVREAYRQCKQPLCEAMPADECLLLAFVWLSDELAPSSTVSDRVGKLISRITEKLRVGEHSMATGQSS